MSVEQKVKDFNQEHQQALRRIWFLGDVHGEFKYLARTLLAAPKTPRWLVLLGDIDIEHKPFREFLEPLKRWFPDLRVTFIHGNHDADTYEHWEMLHDCGDALSLHGQVIDMGGVRVAGLGGHFQGRVWCPPGEVFFKDRKSAMNRGSYQFRGGQKPSPKLHAAIYPDELEELAALDADIMVTHEAPSCHHHGFEVLDDLARPLGVTRTFHGHHHDDRTDQYALKREALGFDAIGIGYCGIKNGLGEPLFTHQEGW